MSERGELYRQALATENGLRQEIARLKVELDAAAIKATAVMEFAADEVERLKGERDDLARQLAAALQAQEAAVAELAEFRRASMISMNAMGDLAQRERDALGRQLAEAQQARDSLRESLDAEVALRIDNKAQRDTLRAEVVRLNAELDVVKGELGVEQEAHRNALESLHRALEHRDDLAGQLAEAAAKAFNAVLEVASARERERDALGTSLAEARELLRRAQTELWGFRDAKDYPVLSLLYAAIAAHLNPPEVL